MNSARIALLAAAVAALIGPASGRAAELPATTTLAAHGSEVKLKIGIAAPETGEMSWVGRYVHEAAAMTVEEINSAPGHRVHVDVVFADSGSTAEGAVRAVHELENQHVSLLLGPMLSAEAVASEPVARQAGIPQVLPISAAHVLTHEGDPWAVRTGEDEWVQGGLLADWLLRHPHIQRIAVVSLPDAYSSSGAEGLVRGLKAHSVQPVLVEQVKATALDEVAGRIKASGAHAVGFFGYPDEAIALLIALRTHQVNAQVVTGCALAGQAFAEKAGAQANGMVIASEFSPKDPAPGAQLFTRRFEARFHHLPSNQHALIYDALWLIHSAALRAGSAAPDRLRVALHHIHGQWEATGDHSIDRTGEDTRVPLLLRLENGHFILMEKGHWSATGQPRS